MADNISFFYIHSIHKGDNISSMLRNRIFTVYTYRDPDGTENVYDVMPQQ